MRSRWLILGTLVAFSCGDDRAAPDALNPPHDDAPAGIDAPKHIDAAHPVDAAPNPLEPTTLKGTGLCVDDACTMIGSGIFRYEPQFTLYADGATKRRWIKLPAGSHIDTTDPDHWDFPIGTQIWKEFTTGSGETPPNVRIETRYMAKVGSDGENNPWFYESYEWNAAQDATTEASMDGVTDANGTQHDIPSHSQCRQCHERLLPTRVLGFNAISLDFNAGSAGSAALLDLDGLIAAGLLTANPAGSASPHYPIPGTATEKAALGYLHANCSHCHNPTSDLVPSGQAIFNVRLETTHLATLAGTTTYTTVVDQNTNAFTAQGSDCATNPVPCTQFPACPGTAVGSAANQSCLITPDSTASSIVFFRMTEKSPGQHMPALGTKVTDGSGVALIQTWINGL